MLDYMSDLFAISTAMQSCNIDYGHHARQTTADVQAHMTTETELRSGLHMEKLILTKRMSEGLFRDA